MQWIQINANKAQDNTNKHPFISAFKKKLVETLENYWKIMPWCYHQNASVLGRPKQHFYQCYTVIHLLYRIEQNFNQLNSCLYNAHFSGESDE